MCGAWLARRKVLNRERGEIDMARNICVRGSDICEDAGVRRVGKRRSGATQVPGSCPRSLEIVIVSDWQEPIPVYGAGS